MITLDTAVQTELEKNANFPVRLFEIGGSTVLRYTDADVDVFYNGKVYERRGVSYQKIQKSLGLDVDQYTITLDNLDDTLITWSVTNDQRGYTSSAFKGVSDGSTNMNGQLLLIGDFTVLMFSGRNTGLKADREFEVTVSANLDFHRERAPRAVQDVTCRFRFKDANCGYIGAETTCNYTQARCKELGNFLRFGGFPDLNERRE